MTDGSSLFRPGVTLKQVEKEFVLGAYQFFHGNKTATASALGVSVRTIDNKLERYEKDDASAHALAEKARVDRIAFAARARGSVVKTSDGFDTLAPVPSVPAPGPVTAAALRVTPPSLPPPPLPPPPPPPRSEQVKKKVVPKPLPVPKVARAKR